MAKVVKCVICGEPFVQVPASKVTCSPECARVLLQRRYKDRPSAAGLEPIKAERKRKAESRLAFLSRRDAEHAAHAAPVKVWERGGVRVETRGRCPCASSLGAHRQMVTDKGVAYVI